MDFSFYITITHARLKYRLHIQRVYQDERIERYQVTGRNKIVILENNRPFFRNKGLRHRKPNWKVYQGQILNGKGLDDIIDAITQQVDRSTNK